MADDKVQIVIEVDAAQAQATLEQFGSAAVKSAKKADDSFSGLQNVFKGATASLLGMVGGFAAITKAIGEAAEEEKNIRALGLALAGTGEYTKEAVKNFQEYADALSNNTGIDDAAILSTITLAKSFGITNEQAKNLTTAAINLSAVTGQDLDSATKQLGATFDGTVGKLGNLGAEFRNLTKDQATNGGAIDLINKKYGEAGASLGDTFEGSLNKLKNSFDDAFKVVGRSILQDGQIKQSIDVLVKSLEQIAPALAEVTKIMLQGTKSIVTGFVAIAYAAAVALRALLELPGQAAGLQPLVDEIEKSELALANLLTTLTAAPEATAAATKSADKFDKTLVNISNSATKGGNAVGLALEEINKKAAETAAAGEKFKSGILSSFGEQTEKETQKAIDALASVDKALKDGIINAEFAAEAKIRINKDLEDRITKQNSDGIEKRQRQEAEAAKIAEEQVNKIASGISKVVGFAGQGKEGAKGAVAAGAGVAANAVLPGSGALVEQIVLLLASGKVAGAFVKEFIKAIPEIFINIADAIPEIIAGIIETVFTPEFLYRLGFAMGKAFISVATLGLTTFAPEWGRKIGEELSKYVDFSAAAEKFSAVFAEIGAFFTGFVDQLKSAFAPITEPIERLIKALGGGGGRGIIAEAGGSGGGKGILAETFGFSKGGIVPLYAANGAFVPRGTDTVPAMLTPGERVLSVGTTGNLDTFMSSQSVGQEQTMAVLSSILQALQAPMVVNAEAKVNQSAFADIILQLNRQNARMTA